MKNQTENELKEKGICCNRCGTGVTVTELEGWVVPEHKVMASLQGTKAKICKGSGSVID